MHTNQNSGSNPKCLGFMACQRFAQYKSEQYLMFMCLLLHVLQIHYFIRFNRKLNILHRKYYESRSLQNHRILFWVRSHPQGSPSPSLNWMACRGVKPTTLLASFSNQLSYEILWIGTPNTLLDQCLKHLFWSIHKGCSKLHSPWS